MTLGKHTQKQTLHRKATLLTVALQGYRCSVALSTQALFVPCWPTILVIAKARSRPMRLAFQSQEGMARVMKELREPEDVAEPSPLHWPRGHLFQRGAGNNPQGQAGS